MALNLTPEQRAQLDALEQSVVSTEDAYQVALSAQASASAALPALQAAITAAEQAYNVAYGIAGANDVTPALSSWTSAKGALEDFLAALSS